MCNDAIELLRNARRLYYFVELLEIRQWLIARLLESNVISDETLECELRNASAVSKEWAEVLIDLYIEYEVSPYMEDFGYLYLETESYCINDIVRIRRKMLGLTQLQVAEGACDERTVRRTEKHQMDPQMYAVRGMFKNLGLYPEYVRARVISTDPEALELYRTISKYANERNEKEWEIASNTLKIKVNTALIHNKQVIEFERIMFDLYTCKKITPEESVEQIKKVLEYTVPLDAIGSDKEWYLTKQELLCLFNMGVGKGEVATNEYWRLLKEYCNIQIQENSIDERIGTNELIISGLINYLGSIGQYQESSKFVECFLRVSLKKRRMRTLAKCLYHDMWNNNELRSQTDGKRVPLKDNPALKRCILLSEITKDKKLKNFLENRL